MPRDLEQGPGQAELPLGHKDVSTTMIYTHFLNRGPAAVRSPADRLAILYTPAPLPAGDRPAEIDCRRPQPIPVRSNAPPSRPKPLPSRGYSQNPSDLCWGGGSPGPAPRPPERGPAPQRWHLGGRRARWGAAIDMEAIRQEAAGEPGPQARAAAWAVTALANQRLRSTDRPAHPVGVPPQWTAVR